MDNFWRYGPIELLKVTHPLDVIRPGAWLERLVFDPRCGQEVALLVADSHDFIETLGNLPKMRLRNKSLALETPYGRIVVSLWTASSLEGDEAYTYEVFFDPHAAGTLTLLRALSEQTHLKVVLFDVDLRAAVRVRQYENHFGFDALVRGLSVGLPPEGPHDFPAAQVWVRANYKLYGVDG